MAVDVGAYRSKIGAALRGEGFACVYVATFDSGRPCRVGYATDLPEAVKRLQRSSPARIIVHDAMWVPDRGIATLITQSVQAAIGTHRRAGGWYDLPAESVAGEVNLTTERLYPNATIILHDQLIARWSKALGRVA